MALWCPWEVQLLNKVRRFERFVADEQVVIYALFEPFVWAMQACLGNETAYLIIDCTQAGPKCRTLVIGLAYHGTILPLRWRTVKGKKGHLKGQRQQELLAEVWPYLQHHRRVVVLGGRGIQQRTGDYLAASGGLGLCLPLPTSVSTAINA